MKRVYGPRLTIGPQSDHYLLLEPIVRVELPERSLPDTGFKIIILLQQDEVGNRTVTGWPSSVRYVNDVDTVSLGPNDITICTLVTVDRGNTWIVELHPVNRPSGDTSAQWGSISGNLDDQPDLKNALDSKLGNGTTAGGDLSGTYPNPSVTVSRGLRETSGPTSLDYGAISDGQPIARIGTTVVGMTGVTWTQAGVLSLPGRINLPTTTSANVGVVSVNGARFLHAFGSSNTFVGSSAGNFTLTGSTNAGFGDSTLQSLTSATGNTAVGFGAIQFNQAGNSNTAVGLQAGSFLNDAVTQVNGIVRCTYIGASARASSVSPSFETVIGASAIGGGSNTVTLGRTSDRVHAFNIRVYNGWTDPNNGQWLQLDNPNASWVRLSAQANGTGAANIGVAISPRGTGAISAQVPDNTATGGNARGTNAVDLQTVRTTATQVASGGGSFIGSGARNTASGPESAIMGGFQNTAGGAQSSIGGGSVNIANGENSTISGGASNIASETATVVSGGTSNEASGRRSWIPGGAQASTRGIFGSHAWSGAFRATRGDCQHWGNVLQISTTDATATILTSDRGAPSTTNVMVLPNNGSWNGIVSVQARDTSGNVAKWTIDLLAKRGANAAATSIVDQHVIRQFSEAALSTAAVTIVANPTRGSWEVQVTGIAGVTIDWIADVTVGSLTHR